ncbi:RluA family pseudouridine synthase [Metabacillus iocasae]|uniref:Pseudouridine synthase n=1 Tax=Priestia iocasae TaxID=2291674 RepID=A0ABS2QT24_9BACI|nr:RluA family pseudouridine synthase [Metabacillus iocasae]MBM7702545.1 23S rRNA pseudouridine1911/1915/1917 synthase [Metabacillus iocasae]
MARLFTLTWKISQAHHGMLLRDFLKDHHISKTALVDIKFRGGAIQVNNKDVTVRYVLQEDDDLCVAFPPEQPSEGLKSTNIPLDIVYEDEYLLVVNKQAGLPSIPSRTHLNMSLSNALLYYYETNQIGSTVHLVNRLDRDTSGLLIVAKNRYVHYLFSKAQQTHSIERTYHALVEGRLALKSGTIHASIGRKDSSIIEREIREDGQHAVTHYTVLEECEHATYVSLKLETGRTHQIRVHMSHLGHPLLGDDLYGGTCKVIYRQALHSYHLTFFHPILQQRMSFTSPIPLDMEEAKKALSLHA